MHGVKDNIKILAVTAAIAVSIAAPLYSYAIDYTTSGNNNSTDLGYTAGGTVEKNTYSTGGGLKKIIRKPEDAIDLNHTPEEIIAEQNTLRQAADVNKSNDYVEEKKEECTAEDRVKLVEMNKKLTKYSSLMEDSYNSALKLSNMTENSVTKSMISDTRENAFKAKDLISEKGFAKDFGLYKKCDTELPDSQFLPVPKEIMTMFE